MTVDDIFGDDSPTIVEGILEIDAADEFKANPPAFRKRKMKIDEYKYSRKILWPTDSNNPARDRVIRNA